jgi:hypothetical protein
MRENWFERFKRWICSKIGHSKGEVWEYNGINSVCKRCNITYKIKKVSKNQE